MSNPSVAITILHQGFVRVELAFHPMQWAREMGDSITIMYDPNANSKPTSDNRNRACSAFLEAEERPDVLFMIDDDIIPQRNPLPIVAKMCTEGSPYDVVGLPAPAWQPQMYPDNPLRWMLFDLDTDGQTLVQDAIKLNSPGMVSWDLVGSGAILIHRRVLVHPEMRAPFADKFNDDGHRIRGHDFNFCHRARAAGFGVWASMNHKCGHCPRVELLDVARMLATARAPTETHMPSWAAS